MSTGAPYWSSVHGGLGQVRKRTPRNRTRNSSSAGDDVEHVRPDLVPLFPALEWQATHRTPRPHFEPGVEDRPAATVGAPETCGPPDQLAHAAKAQIHHGKVTLIPAGPWAFLAVMTLTRPWWFWENYKAWWLRGLIGDEATASL